MSALTDLIISRLTFGPRFNDPAAPTDADLQTWFADQLAAPAVDDPTVLTRLGNVQLPMVLTNPDGSTQTVVRPLYDLFQSPANLWNLANPILTPDPGERQRPADEVVAARWIRAAFSPWQIQEVMTDFWHNHFSINAYQLSQLEATWPLYDQLIRDNALGNFRTLLGATAKSAAMMYYLNLNQSNKIQPNQNYARELMELHTLGIGRYLGLTTPPGTAGTGYSDTDVENVSLMLTGWTIADGTKTAVDGSKPNNGSFIFSPVMHYTGATTVFTINFPAGTGETAGETILDYLAHHPGTANTIATKLYIRFVGDNPPANDPLIAAMEETFLATVQAPNQIAQVLQVLVNHPEFAASAGAKVKTPFEAMISLMRGTGCEINPQPGLEYMLINMGAGIFRWPAPNGMPDIAAAWTGSNDMLQRWSAATYVPTSTVPYLRDGPASLFAWCQLLAQPGSTALTNPSQAVQLLLPLFIKGGISTATMAALTAYAETPEALGAKGVFASPTALDAGLRRLVGAIAASPEFQAR